MNRKIKTFMLATAIISMFSIPAFADTVEKVCSCGNPDGSHTVGTRGTYALGTTYGYSWISAPKTSAEVYTKCTIGGSSKTARGTGWVQTVQISYSGNRTVYQSHGLF